MVDKITCVSCGQSVLTLLADSGREVACPSCSAPITLPPYRPTVSKWARRREAAVEGAKWVWSALYEVAKAFTLFAVLVGLLLGFGFGLVVLAETLGLEKSAALLSLLIILYFVIHDAVYEAIRRAKND